MVQKVLNQLGIYKVVKLTKKLSEQAMILDSILAKFIWNLSGYLKNKSQFWKKNTFRSNSDNWTAHHIFY